ncbi:Enolase-like protein ENO4 [Acipenser ruthenus]|uniref:Enolase-like protein ENO4 n=1 Tax=Acipenser ruthenus TaxID=7906 RepID=A0A444UBU5_ACIRT|nr:Enolase-like protein ENO4 [Acipenser ruthenus]
MSYSGFLNSNSHVSKHVRDFFELKHRAAEYYTTNGVPQKIDVLNSMFYKKTDDVYGYLSICSAAISSNCEPPGPNYGLPEAWEMDDTKRKESVSIALQWINEPLAALLRGHEPADQLKADTLLSNCFQVHVAEKQERMEEERKQQKLMLAVEPEPLPPPQPSAANKKEKRACGKANCERLSDAHTNDIITDIIGKLVN